MSSNMNKALNRAKKNKNDEFYTMYEGIEEELKNYKEKLEGKIIYMPCDDPEWSNFWKYFVNEFNNFKLKKIICTHLNLDDNSSYVLSFDGTNYLKEDLSCNGDFRNSELDKYWNCCDVIITNPPFSLNSDFYKIIKKYNKDFLIILPFTSIKGKKWFELLKNDRAFLGYNKRYNWPFFVEEDCLTKNLEATKKFREEYPQYSDKYIGGGPSLWFTSLKDNGTDDFINLTKEYNEEEYQKYDNCEGINIDKCKDIPKDYYGIMGVPMTFSEKYNKNQFKILGYIEDTRINGIGKFYRYKIIRRYLENGDLNGV